MAAPSTTRAGAEARPTCKPNIRHSWADYSRGLCRCATGREGWRLYGKRRREGRQPPGLVDAIGTQRRVCGLLAMGWPRPEIAEAAGLADQGRVRQILKCDKVLVRTAEGVRRAAAVLGQQVGPSDRVRDHARSAGHPPLWAWDDDIDDPAARPQGVLRLTKPVPALTPALLARFDQYAVPELGSPHVRWTGPTDERGRGKLGYGPKRARSTVSPRKIAYQRCTGRSPVGPVVPRCRNVWCVAGPCMVDEGAGRRQERREARKAAA
jgi:hypothetical protein